MYNIIELNQNEIINVSGGNNQNGRICNEICRVIVEVSQVLGGLALLGCAYERGVNFYPSPLIGTIVTGSFVRSPLELTPVCVGLQAVSEGASRIFSRFTNK